MVIRWREEGRGMETTAVSSRSEYKHVHAIEDGVLQEALVLPQLYIRYGHAP